MEHGKQWNHGCTFFTTWDLSTTYICTLELTSQVRCYLDRLCKAAIQCFLIIYDTSIKTNVWQIHSVNTNKNNFDNSLISTLKRLEIKENRFILFSKTVEILFLRIHLKTNPIFAKIMVTIIQENHKNVRTTELASYRFSRSWHL